MPQIDARGWIFEIESETTDTWHRLTGVTGMSIDRSEGEETAETTTFEDNGQSRSQPMQRGAKCELTCREQRATEDGVQVAGQRRAETLAALVGDVAGGRFRFRHVSQQSWELWPVWVSVGEKSGEINDKTEWSATFTRDGSPTYPQV